MTSLFIGAGFSKWAADLPLVNQLFDFNISHIRYRDEIWLTKLKSHKDKWDSVSMDKNEEAYISYVINDCSVLLQKYLIKYISRRLSEQFLARIYGGSLLSLMIDDSMIQSNKGVLKARQFFEVIKDEDIFGIITTNYDMLLEYALGTNRFNYGEKSNLEGMGKNRMFPWQGIPVSAHGGILLAKIHGSISYDGESYWTTGKPGINGKSVILPPSPEKTRDERFSYEWSMAEQILLKSNKLIVFGFNFNEYDQAVLDLLKGNSKNLKEIHIYDIESKVNKAKMVWNEKIIKEFKVK